MSANSKIEWTDATWTPIRARVKPGAAEIAKRKGYTSLVQIAEKMAGHVGPHCERCSPGCDHCYSETSNARCLPSNGTGLPFDRRARDLVDVILDERILLEALKWKQPRNIFVCSQTDLFGEWVPDWMLDTVFAVMAGARKHTFQVLTKRAKRMREYVSGVDSGERFGDLNERAREVTGRNDIAVLPTQRHGMVPGGWPLSNVWVGVSVEDQQRAGERIPDLLKTPAAVRFLSVEPLLGPVDLWSVCSRHCRQCHGDKRFPDSTEGGILRACPCEKITGLHWVIAGGESGHGARPMHPEWVRSIRDQCEAAGVPFFFKQWGEWLPDKQNLAMTAEARKASGESQGIRVGKHKAGRLLDGRTWDEMPEVHAR